MGKCRQYSDVSIHRLVRTLRLYPMVSLSFIKMIDQGGDLMDQECSSLVLASVPMDENEREVRSRMIFAVCLYTFLTIL